ncbi:hypothetical protein AB1N83_011887 [Pleurotus pulmonarius]
MTKQSRCDAPVARDVQTGYHVARRAAEARRPSYNSDSSPVQPRVLPSESRREDRKMMGSARTTPSLRSIIADIGNVRWIDGI